MKTYHPKYFGFENSLKGHRERFEDTVESTALITIPSFVRTHIYGNYNIWWRENMARMVEILFKMYEYQYGIFQDDNSFEIL